MRGLKLGDLEVNIKNNTNSQFLSILLLIYHHSFFFQIGFFPASFVAVDPAPIYKLRC